MEFSPRNATLRSEFVWGMMSGVRMRPWTPQSLRRTHLNLGRGEARMRVWKWNMPTISFPNGTSFSRHYAAKRETVKTLWNGQKWPPPGPRRTLLIRLSYLRAGKKAQTSQPNSHLGDHGGIPSPRGPRHFGARIHFIGQPRGPRNLVPGKCPHLGPQLGRSGDPIFTKELSDQSPDNNKASTPSFLP